MFIGGKGQCVISLYPHNCCCTWHIDSVLIEEKEKRKKDTLDQVYKIELRVLLSHKHKIKRNDHTTKRKKERNKGETWNQQENEV